MVVIFYLKKLEIPFAFVLGGMLYMLIEILWRGYTHWSMGICSGICFAGIYLFEKYRGSMSIFFKCIFGAFFITLNEFITGCIVNLALGWDVWDYSKTPYNLLGQICLPFSLVWFLLCIPAFLLARVIIRIYAKTPIPQK